MPRFRLSALLGCAAMLASLAPHAATQTLDSATAGGFRWRTVGPANFMGRLSDVVGIPGPSKTLFVSAAAGGIWKSTNNGITWRPVFDDKPVISMGMLAIAKTDTNIVWAGTVEPNSRNSIEPGGGIYKSTDGGVTWTLMGLEKTQHIGRVVVDPRNADVVYVAALGAAWKSNPERGLYKTTDGGKTWALIKFVSDRAGFVDVALDPRNPDVVYASSYERYRTPYSLNSGGPGSALWKSTDAGKTWAELKGNGYPEGTKGRIGLAVAPSNPDVVYALTEAFSMAPMRAFPMGQRPQANGLYRSADGGKTWQRMNNINTRPFYYSQVVVDPRNADRVYFSSTDLQVSNDGGKTSTNAAQGVHVDDHGIWIDPNDPERWALATDGGVAITFDRGGNFFYPMNIPIGQFYEVSYDYAVPYNICGGAQDNGSWCGPSRRRSAINNAYWFTISGGDGFYTAQDPDGDWVWGESQNAGVQGRNLRTGQTLRVTKPTWQEIYRRWEDSIAVVRGDPLKPASSPGNTRIAELRGRQKRDSVEQTLRFNWNSPFFISEHNRRVFYLGGSKVLKSLKRGEEMFIISPDLSKQMKARIDTAERLTGGVTPDVTGAERYGTVVTLAESYLKAGLLLAGTDDGNVWITHNDGGVWENLSDRFTGLPSKDVYVTRVEPSHFDTLTFYVAFDNHRWNDFTPYLYATDDGGKTFRSIASNLPKASPADYLHVVREDPHNRDLLFVGSSIGVYASTDRGRNWSKFSAGLPSVPVYDLKIHPRDRELIAATHGRSFWIADIAALEQMTPKVMAEAATLFQPRTAFQWGEGPTLGIPGNGHGQAPLVITAPAYGANIIYRLKDSASGPVRITVSDAAGTQLFQTNGPARAGLHSVVWAFQGPPTPRRELSPAEKRDSILLRVRAPMVLDSLRKAGFDTVTIARVRQQVAQATNPNPAGPGGVGAGGAGGGGRGAGGGRGGPPAGCEHPLTQWDQFCGRPAEPPPAAGGRGGGRGGQPADTTGREGGATAAAAAATGRGGATGEALDPIQRVWDIIGMRPPVVAGGRGGGGGGGGGAFGGQLAEPGTYVVTLTVNGQTLKQTFRVERVGTGDDVTAASGDEDDKEREDLNGGILPKPDESPFKSPSVRWRFHR
ncbi:MAG: hypothetical protein WKG32_10130 [Gemmatimonadaceae bacterium]